MLLIHVDVSEADAARLETEPQVVDLERYFLDVGLFGEARGYVGVVEEALGGLDEAAAREGVYGARVDRQSVYGDVFGAVIFEEEEVCAADAEDG